MQSVMANTSYADLLAAARPEIIQNNRSRKRALKTIAALMSKQKLSAAEGKLLELLSKLVNDYEDAIYPPPGGSPGDMLQHILDNTGMTQSDLARVVGVPRSTVSEVLNGKRSMSVDNAFRLGEYFHMEPSLFLAPS
jgi:HTH-type transcriptional regulator / antitoxin HigA